MFTTILICVLINIIILSGMYIFFKKNLEKAVTSSSLVESVQREVDELIVELNHTTERNIALIEEKIGRLNRLLKEADNRILVLNKQRDRMDEKTTYEDILASARTSTVKEPQPKEMTTKEKVLKLAGEGIDNPVIANRLGLTLGEVDLIVSLETRKGNASE